MENFDSTLKSFSWWARSACGGPGLYLRRKLIVTHGHRIASVARTPAPHHQLVFRHVFDDFGDRFAAILLWVFDLFADFSVAAVLPDHGRCCGRKSPTRCAGRHVQSGKIVVLVASSTLFCRNSEAIGSATHVHRVRMTIISLAREIPCRV